MRTYISPLGFDSTRVTRPILNHGIGADDTIVLLRPADNGDDNRGEEAVEDVRRMVTEIAPEMTVTVEQLTPDDFATAVRECVDILQAAHGEVVANFGGGPRELFLPFTVASLVFHDRVDIAFQFGDISGAVREIPLPDLTTPISEQAFDTLERTVELGGSTTLPELAQESGRSKSTIGRHLDHLETAGAVTTEQRGKTRHVALELSGELRLAARA